MQQCILVANVQPTPRVMWRHMISGVLNYMIAKLLWESHVAKDGWFPPRIPVIHSFSMWAHTVRTRKESGEPLAANETGSMCCFALLIQK